MAGEIGNYGLRAREMTTGKTINYEALQQDALRGVVRAVLNQIVASGLPGDHHFYISFLTQSPGVIMSKRLKEKYPHEMTIVLQHRFWDLIVSEDRFEVKLTFDGIPERLVVPYRAIKVFIDPSVRFGLQFDESNSDREAPSPRHTMTADAAFDQASEALPDSPRATLAKKPRPVKKTKAEKDNSEPQAPKPAPAAIQDTTQPLPKLIESDAKDTPASVETGAKVVSLDQFRKK